MYIYHIYDIYIYIYIYIILRLYNTSKRHKLKKEKVLFFVQVITLQGFGLIGGQFLKQSTYTMYGFTMSKKKTVF